VGELDPVTTAWDEPIADFSVSPNIHEQTTADVTLTGTLDWFGWREEVAIGGDFTRLEYRGDNGTYLFSGPPLRDPRSFDPQDYPDPRLARPPDIGIATTSTTDQYGMFASMRIYFDGAWSITGGARISGDDRDAQLTTRHSLAPGQLVTPWDGGTDHVVTPFAGLMYSFDRHYSLYASYADVYLSQTLRPQREPGVLLGPIRGVNIEAGIKGEWRNGALNGSLAIYQIEQSNLLKRITTLPFAQDCCFTGVRSKSQGLDVDFSGEVMPGWDIGAGYSYNDYEAAPDELVTMTPKHLLKAWANVQLPGSLSRWQIGGSLHAQTETKRSIIYCPTFVNCNPVDKVQHEHAVFDLRASFDIDRHWRVALSVNNVLDEVYYETVALRAWYGEPRNWMLRIDGRY
jgi:outer-membrane receptor for ferric coprogen and ferric-rhodotorulic acid